MSEVKLSEFELTTITDLSLSKIGDKLPTSDFSIISGDNKFMQYTLIEGTEEEYKTEVKAGIFAIVKEGNQIKLKTTSFTNDSVLKEYDVASTVAKKIDNFFNKIAVYEKYNIFPKRGILLHGKPGCGKTQSLAEVATRYAGNGDTAIILWSTSEFEASSVKSLIKSFEYINVTKLILIVEDIGGGEYVGGKMAVKASLLSLLDNVEQTFTIPTMVVATTNYPENLLEVLTNRPQRFDDIVEVKAPSGLHRSALLKFFMKGAASEAALTLIAHIRFDGLSVAHIKEIPIRAELHDLSLVESIKQVYEQSIKAKNDFQKAQGRVGIGSVEDDEW